MGCQQVDEGEEKYYEMTNLIINDTKADNIKDLDIEIFKHHSDDNKYLYEIILSNPKINFEDLKIIALPTNYDYDELLPNFNVLENVDISEFNNKNQNIKLNFFSQNDYREFKVLIQYQNNNQEHQEIQTYKVK